MATFPVNANVKPAITDIDQLVAALRKAGKEAGLTEDKIEQIVNATRKAKEQGGKNLNNMNNELGKINGTLKTVGTGLAAVFAADQVKQFVGELVRITSEFQKMEAVLTNTLGSKGQAQLALRTISEIAAKTPFSVLQLTQSYIKLVNQGFKPTAAEIIKLGDLAASTGKEFDMLTEAIIDAQTGEFERLKEFGIRASKAGDQVTFTFKGVETQTKFTAEAIRQYILSLGEAQGVSGSMAAISETLGGAISNAGDVTDTFFKVLGEGNKGVLMEAVTIYRELVEAITEVIKTEQQRIDDKELRLKAQAVDMITAEVAGYKNLDDAQRLITQSLETERARLKARNDEIYRGVNVNEQEYTANFARLDQIKRELDALAELIPELKKKQKAQDDGNKASKKQLEFLKDFEEAYRKGKEDTEREIETARVRRENTEALAEAQRKLNKELEEQAMLRGDFFPITGMPEQEKAAKSTDELLDELRADRVNKEKEAADMVRDYQKAALQEVFKTRVVQTQVELAMLENRFRHEQELVGDNEKARTAIETEFNRKRVELLRRQAKQEQDAALFSIAVNQGPAIAKTISTLGMPAAIPFILAVGALFALQQANTRKLAQVRYAADGDYNIDGPGTETSDSIPYMLSKHESVVHAKGTRKFGPLVKGIIEDDGFDWGDVAAIADKNLPTEYRRLKLTRSGNDRSATVDELREIKKAIINKKETRMHFDENGFSQWVGSQGNWEKFVSDRYKWTKQ